MNSRYAADIDIDAANNTHAMLVRMVGTDARVLELGAASGYMTRVLRERGCRVTAVEFDPDAEDELRAAAHDVVIGDLEDPVTLEQVRGEFDVLLAGDVLEHLRDPLAVLAAGVAKLAPGGRVVISIPNVGHADLRLALLQGRFGYTETGLLDRTHLRFFTYESLLELLTEAGLLAVDVQRSIIRTFETELAVPRASVAPEVFAAVLAVAESETYQFVVTAVRAHGDPELAARAQQRLGQQAERAWEDASEIRDWSLALVAEADAGRRHELDAARTEVADIRRAAAAAREERDRLAGQVETMTVDLAELRTQRDRQAAEIDVLAAAVAAEHELLAQLRAARLFRALFGYRVVVERLLPPGSRRRTAYHRVIGSTPKG